MTEIDSGALVSMLQNKGVDPSVLAMLRDRKDGLLEGDGLILLFLLILFGGGNGFGLGGKDNYATKGDVAEIVNNTTTYAQLMDAISTQGMKQEMAMNALSQSLGCSINSIQTALMGVDKTLAVNQGSIINAIQSCCCNLQGVINTSTAGINLNVERVGNGITNAIQSSVYDLSNQLSTQSQLIQSQFCQQNSYLATQFGELKQRELEAEVQRLRDINSAQRDSTNTQLILNAIEAKGSTTSTTG